MRTRFVMLTILMSIVFTSAHVVTLVAQNAADPVPQCVLIGRGAGGPGGEIQCVEDALKVAPANNAQVPAMLFWLAKSYENLGETKAEDYYRKLVDDHCKTAQTDLCKEAKTRLDGLEAIGRAPRQIDTPFTPSSF